MNNPYQNNQMIVPTIPPNTPTLYEKKRIRKEYSTVAWICMITEILNIIIYFIMATFLPAEKYNDEGLLIYDVPMIICSFLSCTITYIIMSISISAITHKSMKPLFKFKGLDWTKILLVCFITLGFANVTYTINIFISNGLYNLGYECLVGNYTDPIDTPSMILDVFTSVITAPIFEEIFYRGIIMGRLSKISKRMAVIVSALIFGLAHGNIYQFILCATVGIIFGLIDIKTGSIIPSIICHMVLNSHTYISNAFYNCDENLQYILQIIEMAFFICLGIVGLVIYAQKYGFNFPTYTEYHKKRFLPIIVTSIPFWIYLVFMIYNIVSIIQPIAE